MTHDPDDMDCMCGLCWNPAPEPSAEAHRPVWRDDVPTGWCECGSPYPHMVIPEPSAEADAALDIIKQQVAYQRAWGRAEPMAGIILLQAEKLAALSRPATPPLDVEHVKDALRFTDWTGDLDRAASTFLKAWDAYPDDEPFALANPTPEPGGGQEGATRA